LSYFFLKKELQACLKRRDTTQEDEKRQAKCEGRFLKGRLLIVQSIKYSSTTLPAGRATKCQIKFSARLFYSTN
jgi:hypothetical protein